MDNQYSDHVAMLLNDAEQMLERSIAGDTATGSFYCLRGIGYALVAIGKLMALPVEAAASAEAKIRLLRAENDRLDAALQDAYVLQDCGHPRACIVHDDDDAAADWCEACVLAAAGLRSD